MFFACWNLEYGNEINIILLNYIFFALLPTSSVHHYKILANVKYSAKKKKKRTVSIILLKAH